VPSDDALALGVALELFTVGIGDVGDEIAAPAADGPLLEWVASPPVPSEPLAEVSRTITIGAMISVRRTGIHSGGRRRRPGRRGARCRPPPAELGPFPVRGSASVIVRHPRAVRIETVQGDITEQQVDVIVNAANGSLMGGGGVDGAIHRRGGPSILAECRRIRADRYPDGLPTGHAVATGGGSLPARWVIHTVGPVYSRSEDRSALLASCHTESLRVADEVGAETVAFPAISTGVYGYPLDLAAPVAVAAVRGAPTKVELVRFVLFDAAALRSYEDALGAAADERAG
jgi:O-acetyl-ADP-ribose deacetylase (regulator of RNase III)